MGRARRVRRVLRGARDGRLPSGLDAAGGGRSDHSHSVGSLVFWFRAHVRVTCDGLPAMTVSLLPPRKWTLGIKWLWITMVVMAIVVAVVDGFMRR